MKKIGTTVGAGPQLIEAAVRSQGKGQGIEGGDASDRAHPQTFDSDGMFVMKIGISQRLNILFKNRLHSLSSRPLLYRLAHGAAWSLIGSVVARFSAMITSIYIARLLGKESFGAYGMVQSTIGMFGLLAGAAMGATMTKYLAEFRVTDPLRAGRILSLTTSVSTATAALMSLSVLILAHPLATRTLNRPELGSVLSIAAILLFTSTLNNIQIGSLAGFEAFERVARVNAIQGAATPCIMIPLVYFYKVQGAVIGLALISALGFSLCQIFLMRECRRFSIPFPHFSAAAFHEWRVLVNFSLPATATGLLVTPVTWLCNTILVNQRDGYGQLGLFTAANQWRQVIAFLPQVLTSVMLPIYSGVHGHDKARNFAKALTLNLRIILTITLPITVLFILFRKPLSSLFGAQYTGTDAVLVILMLVALLNVIDNAIGIAITGAGRVWMTTAFCLLWAVALIACSVFLVPLYGGVGLAFSHLIAYFLIVVAQMTYAERVLAPSAIRRLKGTVLVSGFSLSIASLCAFWGVYAVPLGFLATTAAFYPLWQVAQEALGKKRVPAIPSA